MSDSIRVLQKVIVVAFLATIALTLPAWFDARPFPTAPVFEATPLPCEASLALLALLVGSLVMIFFRPHRSAPAVVMAGAYAVFVLFDQSRLMPYLLQYVVMLVVLGWGSRGNQTRADVAWGMCQLILFSVYLWAGIQKFNVSFVLHGFPWFIEPFIGVIPEEHRVIPLLGGVLVPLIESGLALLLLSAKRRRVGVIGLTGMHLGILLCLGPLGHNWNHAVWPWNIVMIVSLWILFSRPFGIAAMRRYAPVSGLVALFYLILPAFNLVGLWDDYLSHSLYSRRGARAVMKVHPEDVARLPRELHSGFITRDDGRIELSFVNYSMLNLGLPVYPEERVFQEIGRELCRRYALSNKTATVVYGKPDRRSGAVFTERDECESPAN